MAIMRREYLGQEVFIEVYYKLIRAALDKGTITYGDIAQVMKLQSRGNHMSRETGQMVGEISEWEHIHGRPLLSAVVLRGDTGKPGEGFFELARDLGRLSKGQDETKFWKEELAAVYVEWGPKTKP